ncbi:transglycosylase domain-containing protein [Caproiciproducens sp. CPB-2]|uniref:transglycosylase domain-containing protein n=1 Tax=Caproiciproducens sp. CPB-2 TaxID=3030017 RepID=UPI0023DADC9A|nr:transglycosylase domain-containing protein [Caproiciproducens sp. CPB-2]MDF1494292.1 transglycosylase domain-containing protein [Caproiciproducens sp. CPB-2]
MRKTDINKYVGSRNGEKDGKARSVGRIVLKGLFTVFTILFITGIIVSVSLLSFVFSLSNESVDYDLHKLQLNYTSFIYVNGPNDDSSNPVQYQSLYSSENRVWVDYDKIPQSMKDAIIAIEDKRFKDHKGVDWIRTAGAVTTLFSKGSSYGGSTITQQLIKNITGDKDVSLTRKVKEIFRALNLEQKYTKEEILAAYLNVVPFGSGSNGVQAAANLYFGKNIQDCDIAECAAIAGITQNPTKYSPLVHPDQNKERQQTVLNEMHVQGMITDAEYNTAMTKSEHMTFVGKKTENVVDDVPIWNWYVDTLFEDVKSGLMEHYNCSSEKAVDMIYHDGLKIYAAMDTDLQNIAENTFKSDKLFGSNTKMQAGYLAMDYSGRVLATVGSRGEKKSNRLFSLSTDSKRQPGSTIKPLAVYGPAIESGKYNYSSLVNDNPLPNWFSDGSSGPKNWGPGNTSGKYWGPIPLEWALERSLNASAAQVGNAITPNVSFNFLKEKLGFTSLLPADNNRAPMAIGGLSEGVTVREMTAGFQIFANGGKYYQPYTFYHVDDHDGNVILDNRNQTSVQAISSTTSSIMHHLLNNVVTGAHGTGRGAAISGWEVFGKTGTTNDEKDSWFIGGTPYAVAGIWTGYLTPAHLTNTTYAASTWKNIMASYLKNKEKLTFTYDPNVVSARFCTVTGLLANPANDKDTQIGWYDKSHMPAICDGIHAGSASSVVSHPVESGTESGESAVSSGGESHENPDTSSEAPTSSTTPESHTSSARNSRPDKPSKPGRPQGDLAAAAD